MDITRETTLISSLVERPLEKLISELLCGDDRRAESAAVSLAARGSSVIPLLAPLLDSPQVEQRWWALRTLAEIQDSQVGKMLLPFLDDPAPEVQQCAALGLRHHPSAKALPALLACLNREDRLLARLAADALIAIGEAAVPALMEVLREGPQPARPEGTRALATIADPRAIPLLLQALQNGDSSLVEYWADVGLERMGVGMVFFNP
jgi:HEAT repeat protein